MAKHDHCNICDYSEANGSTAGNTRPGSNGKVRRHGEDMLCDACISAVSDNLQELSREDKDDENPPW
jgi:hypothetical protein